MKFESIMLMDMDR